MSTIKKLRCPWNCEPLGNNKKVAAGADIRSNIAAQEKEKPPAFWFKPLVV